MKVIRLPLILDAEPPKPKAPWWQITGPDGKRWCVEEDSFEALYSLVDDATETG